MLRAARITTFILAIACVAAPIADASLIPAFARRHRVSCSLCHTLLPKLNAFGEQYAGNGFRMSANAPPRDTINTGDELLQLYRDLPLAIRVDAYISAYTAGESGSDLQTPYNVKILSGGPISRKFSYYLYFFLFERGEVGGIEDAFVYLDNIAGQPIDLAAGQFQVSDPMFKRELRLENHDYAVYRARVGLQPTDLTYDRGLMVMVDVAGFTITGEVVNGNGRGEAEPNRRLDNDPFKNVFGHVTRDLTPNLRLGAMGYFGQQEGAVGTGPTVKNTVWMAGADATVTAGPIELNVQYLHREDDTPTFTSGEPEATLDGGFAELVLHPANARWYVLGLYNLIDADRPLLNVRLGAPGNIGRYETLTAGAGYLVRRNFRVLGEATWDTQLDEARWTIGLSTAF
jgi:hypothetical protein